MNRIVIYIVIALVLIGLGVGITLWARRHRIAQYDQRERERMEKIAANEAEQNKLRGENEQLRKDIAGLSADKEALQAIIKEHGGNIAKEGQQLEKLSEELKKDQAVINAPADKCVRCRRFSATALAARLIDRPLSCAEECAGLTQ